jgi:hypothetical protein
MVLSVIAASFDFIPNRYHNIHRLQPIQGMAHLDSVCYAGPALHPVTYEESVLIRIPGINVSKAVAGRVQTGDESWDAIISSPGKPAKIAGLRAVENILNKVTNFYIVEGIGVQRYRIEFTGGDGCLRSGRSLRLRRRSSRRGR